MEYDQCWETFLTSGKVTDYLNYKKHSQCQRESVTPFTDSSRNCGGDMGGITEYEKVTDGKNAGFY